MQMHTHSVQRFMSKTDLIWLGLGYTKYDFKSAATGLSINIKEILTLQLDFPNKLK